MTANILRFNNSEYKTCLDDGIQRTIANYCEPSYQGINNDSDLYAIDYVIDVMHMNKQAMSPDTDKETLQAIDKVTEQLTALQGKLEYIAIDQLWES